MLLPWHANVRLRRRASQETFYSTLIFGRLQLHAEEPVRECMPTNIEDGVCECVCMNRWLRYAAKASAKTRVKCGFVVRIDCGGRILYGAKDTLTNDDDCELNVRERRRCAYLHFDVSRVCVCVCLLSLY